MSVKSLQFLGTDVNVDLEVHVDVNVEEHYLAQRCLSCKFFSIPLTAGAVRSQTGKPRIRGL